MRSLFLSLTLLLASCALTPGDDITHAPFTRGEAPPAAVEDYPISVALPAGTYRLDRRHASVLFRIRHMDLSWFTARLDTIDATLTLDPVDPTRSQLAAQADANSVSTNVLTGAGERAFDALIGRALGGEMIRFTSTSIVRTGRYTAQVTGDLTLNGQTRPATLDVTFGGGRIDPLRGGAMVLGFSAHGVIDRRQWGIDEWRAFASDEVQLVIEAELVRT